MKRQHFSFSRSVKSIPNRKDILDMCWLLLKLIGIDTNYENGTKKCFQNKISLPFIIFYSICLVIWLMFYVNCCLFLEQEKYIRIICLMYAAAAISTYFSLMRKSRELQQFRKLLNTFPVPRKPSRMFYILYCMIFLCMMKPTISSLSHIIYEEERLLKYFLLFPLENKTVKVVTSSLNLTFLIILDEGMPSVLNLVFCALCHYWKEVIATTRLEISKSGKELLDGGSPNLLCLLRRCHSLWHTTKFMKDTFSFFLACLIALFVVTMFLLPALVTKNPGEEFQNLQFKIQLCLSAIHFTCCVYFASKIPEEIEELVECLGEIRGGMVLWPRETEYRELRKQLKIIATKKPIALSVGGWVEMRKSFIFVTFGSLVSYGFLVIQNA